MGGKPGKPSSKHAPYARRKLSTLLRPKSSPPHPYLDYISVKAGIRETHIRDLYAQFVRACPTGTFPKADFSNKFKHFYPRDVSHGERFVQHVLDNCADADSMDFEQFVMAANNGVDGTPGEKLGWAVEVCGYYLLQEDVTEVVKGVYKMHYLFGSADKHLLRSAERRAVQMFGKMGKVVEEEGGQVVVREKEFLRVCMQDEKLVKMLQN